MTAPAGKSGRWRHPGTMKKAVGATLVVILAIIGFDPAAANDLDFPVLMYHDFTSDSDGLQFQMPTGLFKQQMQHLLDHGYQTVLPQDLEAAANGTKPLPPKPVMLTFDDWFPSHYALALPILDRLGLKGVFFVPSKKARTEDEKQKLRKTHRHGHVIASHTVNHSFLTKTRCRSSKSGCCQPRRPCNDEQIEAELVDSKRELEAIIGAPVTAFAWPGNYFDQPTIKLAKAAGYQTIFAVEHQVKEHGELVNVVGRTTGLDRIHRIEIGGRCNLELFPLTLQDHRCCLVSDREFHRHCRPRENELLAP